MGLADITTLLTVLPELRDAAESLMTDQCVVRRSTGTATSPTTFAVTPTLATVYGPAKFKLASDNAFEQDRESGSATMTLSRVRCDFPFGSGPFLPGDVVTLTAVDSTAGDPNLVGRHFRLTIPAPQKTHATAYRVYAEELVGVEVPPWTE